MSCFKLESMPDGRPALVQEGNRTPIHVVPCFPWTHPNQFLSLRDDDGTEQALIQDTAELDPSSRDVLEKETRTNGHVFTITGILHVAKEIELRCWEVTIPGGERHFQTELDEWPRALPDGSLLIQDLYNDLYRIPDPSQLDPASRKLLLPLLG